MSACAILNRLLREIIQQEQRKKGLEPRDFSQRSALADKSFAFYTEDDIRRMNDAVARLAQRLKNRLSVRRKKAARGRFDVKKTLRKNLQYGGVPFKIQLDRRKKTKPQVMVLCDISDSVLNASRFMLQFVYSVQDLYSKVRSFVFVAEIGEVTKLFEEHDIQTRGGNGAQRRRDRCVFPFQLRPRFRTVSPKLFYRDQRQNHRVDHRRRQE